MSISGCGCAPGIAPCSHRCSRSRCSCRPLALIGFANAGRELRARAERDPAWLERLAAAQNWLDRSEMGWIYATERQVLFGFTVVLLATLGARTVRTARARYGRRVRLRYPDGVTVSIEPGMSVLEASRAAGVPHASVCGGRGRCSTCRVRVGHGGLGRRALGLAR